MNKEQMSVKAFSQKSRIPTSKVIRMIRAGKIRAKKPEGGWAWIIPQSELKKVSAS